MSSSEDLGNQIAAINDRLKAAHLPVRVRLRGKSALTLQATLPLRSGVGRKQQEISLGIAASRPGLRRIESEAHALAQHLIHGTFRWELYSQPQAAIALTTSELIVNFKTAYFAANRITEATWRESWQRTFDRLPQTELLSEVNILAVIFLTENHTRSRELTCQRLQRLADFANLAIDLKPYQGNYSEKSLTPRDIPSDALIVEWGDLIPNRSWQWVYGMMATFGLRPHECWFCEFVTPRKLEITEGKTGYHVSRPILPEWVDRWNLTAVDRPNVTGRTFRDYGMRTRRQFQRYGVPFNPYDLRHAYAIRGSVVKGLPTRIMADQMGHSEAIHTKTYQRWLKEATADEVFDRLIE